MPKSVQLPDGSVVEFPDGMSDDAIGGAIKQHLASTPTPPVDMSKVAGAPSTGLPQPANFSKSPAATSAIQPPAGQTLTTNLLKTGEAYKGALKSIPGTLSGIAKLAPGTPDATEPLDQIAQTNGPEQAYGKAVGNAAQGGSFGGGAAAGAAGGLFGMGLQKVAPMLAETALGVRAGDRAYGRTPGQGIMSETTGISPRAIADQASAKTTGYTDTLNNNAVNSKIPVDLTTGRDVAKSFLKTATKQNNRATIREVGEIGDQLAARPSDPAPIPSSVSADEALALRRGVDTLHGSWNPNNARPLSDSAINAT